MDELEGILQGQDMLFAGGIDQVDHGGQGGGLARTGRAGDQHQPFFQMGHLPDPFRQAQVVRGQDLAGDDAEDRGDSLVLHEDIAAEAGQTGNGVGKVQVIA